MLVAGLGAGVAYAVESGDSTADATEQTQVASGQETSESQDASEDSVAEGAEGGESETADAQNAGQDGVTGGSVKNDDGSTDKADTGSETKVADTDANNADTDNAGISTLALNTGTVQGVSPRGTTIDLFDYTAPAINNGHELQFSNGKSEQLLNSWTGNGGNHYKKTNQWGQIVEEDHDYGTPRTGIVADTLGDDGYPHLSGGMLSGRGNDGEWSYADQQIGTESLNYLFDDTTPSGKKAYQDVSGLLQVSDDGYYYYDSQKNFAHFDEDSNGFTLYDKPAVTNGNIHGQFFPFANMNDVSENVEASATLNYHFGVAMETQFMQSDGGRNNGKDVTYEFSGDDDVWVFIDGVLVGDLGGIHDPVSIDVNFRTGEITVKATGSADPQANVAIHKTLRECFQAAGKDGTTAWNGSTFADDTYHTLNFFYMERGQGASNMSLKYNLVMIPQSEIQKVDQDGNPVPNAEFTLSVADSQYQNPQQVYQGTTDRDGSIILMDSQRHAITLDNIWNQYGGSLGYNAGAGGGNRLNLILKETSTPSGYRSGAGEYRMYLWHVPNEVNSQESTLLLSDNPWTTGAYAQSKVSVTAPNTFTYTENGQTQNVTTANALAPGEGMLFAVVEKRSDSTSNDWRIVSGDALNGWKVRDDNDVATAVEVYKSIANTEATTSFELGRSGGYESVVANLPGRIQDYTYFAGNDGLYRGAYYYSSDASNVTSGNTYRVTDDSMKQFGREFSALLYVPNTINRVIVQKTDDAGNPVSGAEFTMYYSNADDTGPDRDNPVGQPETTHTLTRDKEKIDLDGAAVFTKLNAGTYWIEETKAPAGYAINTTPAKVIVTNDGVYADAGEAGDGIEVTRGVGRIVRSMLQFATDDDIDATLHHIVATPQIGDAENNSWTDVKDAKKLHLHYGGDGKVLDYGVETPTTTDNRRFTVDEGIPYLKVQQCNNKTVANEDNVHVADPRVFDLGDTDISGLFTGVTIVQVTDQRVGSLKISKTVTGENAPQGATFTFDITLADGEDKLVSGKFTARVYDADNNQPVADSISSIEFTDGKATVALQSGQYVVIEGLSVGTAYTVTEQTAAGYTPSYTVNNAPSTDGSTVNGSVAGLDTNPGQIGQQVGVSGWAANQTVAFTNKYAPSVTASFTIAKQIEGRDWLPDDTFSFLVGASENYGDAVTMPTDSGAVLGTKEHPVVINAETSDHETAYGDITFTKTGTYQFTVTEVSGDAKGMTYSDAEFTVTVEVENFGTDPKVTVERAAGADVDGSADSGTDTVTFINRFGRVAALPLTGGGSTARNVVLAGGGILLLAGAAWLLTRRRRA